jgi:hypothetical protein
MVQVLDKVSTVLAQKGFMVWSVSPDATVYSALELIADKGIGVGSGCSGRLRSGPEKTGGRSGPPSGAPCWPSC